MLKEILVKKLHWDKLNQHLMKQCMIKDYLTKLKVWIQDLVMMTNIIYMINHYFKIKHVNYNI